MKKTRTTRSRRNGQTGYGSGFITRPWQELDKSLESLKRLSFRDCNPLLPSYEFHALIEIWNHVSCGLWPGLRVSEMADRETPGCMLRDWTEDFVLIGSRFDLGPFECMASLYIPVAAPGRMGRRERISLSVDAEDDQCLADLLGKKDMRYLKLFFRKFTHARYRLDFEAEPFFSCETPYTEGVVAYERLLDHLQTMFTINSPEILCPGLL